MEREEALLEEQKQEMLELQRSYDQKLLLESTQIRETLDAEHASFLQVTVPPVSLLIVACLSRIPLCSIYISSKSTLCTL